MKSGEPDGNGGRWCSTCNHSHGSLYICPSYSDEVKAEIESHSARYRDNLRDPAWCDEQLRGGVPEFALRVMGAFAGVTPRSGKPS